MMANWRDKFNGIQIEEDYSGPNLTYYPSMLGHHEPAKYILGEDFLRQQLDDLILAVQLDPLRKLPQALSIWIADELGIE
jgi:hypothetical protein